MPRTMNFLLTSFLIVHTFTQNSHCIKNFETTCYSKCAAVQCLKPECSENQTLITYHCTCCPVCVTLKRVKGQQCSENCPSNFCELADIRCAPLDCQPGQIVFNRGAGPCGCCPVCAYEW